MARPWTQYILKTLADGATGGTVTFEVPFMTVPVSVDLWVVLPNESADPISVVASAITTTGCTFTLSDTLAEAGYILQGSATAIQPTPVCSPCVSSSNTPVTRPTTQSATVEIPSGAETLAVNFPVEFAGIPSVVATVIKADDSHWNLFPTGYTITATGFSVSFNAMTDDDTYQLSYIARFS